MADTDDAILNRNTWANYDCWHWHDANLDLRDRPTCRNPCAS